MPINFKQSLEQKMMMKLSPQQVQLMKLLQVPTLALEERIKEELENNPALEEEEVDRNENAEKDTNDIEDYSSETSSFSEEQQGHESNDLDYFAQDPADKPVDSSIEKDSSDFNLQDYMDPEESNDYDYKLKDHNYPNPDEEYHVPVSFRMGFHESLINQLGMLQLSQTQRQIGEVIIGNIDEAGYLQRSVEAMVNDLAFSQNIFVSALEIEKVLLEIQKLEPSGVGARNLRECLLIQLRNLEAETEALPFVTLAYQIIDRCFEEFVKRQYEKICEKLKISEEDLKKASEKIVSLNPKPGESNHDTDFPTAPTIMPDFYLSNEDGVLILSLNSKNDPNLRVSPTYSRMLRQYGREAEKKTENSSSVHTKKKENREAAFFIKQKIDSARWFIELIKQRQNTLLNTMQAIVDYQQEYFLAGDISKLRPMRLKDIAEKTALDISTISRVANNKYIQTHFGTFLLKKFFSNSMENEQGEKISTSEIKSLLAHLIQEEDKSQPLNDDALVEALKTHGFPVARRTVAKYREGLGISVARLRRIL
ncbi:MAG: RNA polymerase factor sigma-54 [Bacteroidales bacterium]